MRSHTTNTPLRFSAPRQPIAARGRLQVVNLNSNDIKNGMSLEIDGAPYRVTEFLHVKPGKGSAFVRTKLKNYITGTSQEKTFRAGEPITAADMNKANMQFTYKDGDMYVFMDMETYEETRLPEDETWSKYLKEGMEADVLTWSGTVVGVQIPNTVTLEVTECDPGLKGNTAQGGSKSATLETGAVIQVPLFINVGDMLQVDTRSNEYLKRSTD